MRAEVRGRAVRLVLRGKDEGAASEGGVLGLERLAEVAPGLASLCHLTAPSYTNSEAGREAFRHAGVVGGTLGARNGYLHLDTKGTN